MTALVFRADEELRNWVLWLSGLWTRTELHHQWPVSPAADDRWWDFLSTISVAANSHHYPLLIPLSLGLASISDSVFVSVPVFDSVLVFVSIPVFVPLCISIPIFISLSCVSVCPYFCLYLSFDSLFLSLTLCFYISVSLPLLSVNPG